MQNNFIDELNNLQEVKVCLESFGGDIPTDAKEILSLYFDKPVDSEVSLEDFGKRAADILKRFVQWLAEMAMKFKDWLSRNNPMFLLLKTRLKKAKETVPGQEFKHGEITFRTASKLAVAGNLNDGVIFNINNAVGMLKSFFLDSRQETLRAVHDICQLSSKYLADAENIDLTQRLVVEKDLRKGIILKVKPLANRIEQMFKHYKQSNAVGKALTKKSGSFSYVTLGNAHIVATDLMPGDYAVFTLMVEHNPIFKFEEGMTDTQALNRLIDAVKNIPPKLEHVPDQGRSFKNATALDEKASQQLLTEVDHIVKLIDDYTSVDTSRAMKEINDLLKSLRNSATTDTYWVTQAIDLSKGMVRLVDFGSFNLLSYLTGLGNASLDYINASLDKNPEPEVVPNYPALQNKA